MKNVLFFFLFSAISIEAKEPLQSNAEPLYEPIFAGTLLAFMSTNISPGNWLLEPYLFVGSIDGSYKSNWQTQHHSKTFESQLLWLVETGITPWLDVSLYTAGDYTSCRGEKSYLYGDTRVALGFQVSKNQIHSWIPDFRLLILENFPSGKYDHLNPHKQLADASGSGSYETWIISVIRKIIYLAPRQPITVNLTLQYDVPSKVHAKGYNLYGGNSKTNTLTKSH